MDARSRIEITNDFATGRFAEAARKIDLFLRTHPDDLMAHALHGTCLLELGESEAAHTELTNVAKAAETAGDRETAAFAQLWLGYAHNRKQDHTRAVHHFEQSARLTPPSPDLCAALCQTLGTMGETERAREWGARALEQRAAEGTCPADERVPRQRPRAFDPAARARNILSFSLFGKERYYQECAVTIARSARGIFPEFLCRFYCGPEIPEATRKTLAAAKAQVAVVTAEKDQPMHPHAPLMWRFMAFDDPNVHVVLVRDVDSPFTVRERGAVDLWLASDAPFLTMRDHLNHTEPLMAGMWGGFTGLLPPLGANAFRFRPPTFSRYVDQAFLRLFVWPRIRDATLSVDSVYSLGNTIDYPAAYPRERYLSVGLGWPRAHIVGGA